MPSRAGIAKEAPLGAPVVPASAYGPVGPVATPNPQSGAEAPTAGQRVDAPMCWRCNRVLADYLTMPFSLRCPKCKAQCTAE